MDKQLLFAVLHFDYCINLNHKSTNVVHKSPIWLLKSVATITSRALRSGICDRCSYFALRIRYCNPIRAGTDLAALVGRRRFYWIPIRIDTPALQFVLSSRQNRLDASRITCVCIESHNSHELLHHSLVRALVFIQQTKTALLLLNSYKLHVLFKWFGPSDVNTLCACTHPVQINSTCKFIRTHYLKTQLIYPSPRFYITNNQNNSVSKSSNIFWKISSCDDYIAAN